MKRTVNLDQPLPLAAQIAGYLLSDRNENIRDLSDTLVLIPTAGAARAIRHELAKHGVLSPSFQMPMAALLPTGISIANQMEREAAWALTLDPAQRKKFNTLIPEIVPLTTAHDQLGIAARLCRICDELAEAGLDPRSTELSSLLENDAPRWKTFGEMYRQYLDVLNAHHLQDPNDARIKEAQKPSERKGIRRVVVACIPDLPLIAQRFLESVLNRGLHVHVLVWNPSGQAEHLDAWGRPSGTGPGNFNLANAWKKNAPQIPDGCLIAANDPATEAGLLLDWASLHKNTGYALFSNAPESSIALAQEIAWRGAEPYLPEGRALAQSEAAGILEGWNTFCKNKRLRDLRVLLQKPAFLSYVTSVAGKPEHFTPMTALDACDRIISEHLCETLEAARSWLLHAEKHKPANDKVPKDFLCQQDLIRAAYTLLREITTGAEMMATVTKRRGHLASGSRELKELESLTEITQRVAHSPLLSTLSDDLRTAGIYEEIRRQTVSIRAADDAIEIQGWLEAPWSSAPSLVVAGCREGALPSGTHDDPFLPDSAKSLLGLMTLDARFARDAYLLSCLLASRPHENIRLGFSRFRSQGEPNRPSRLLFGCPDETLAARSALLFKPAPPSSRAIKTDSKFSLRIPKRADGLIESIRVTSFKNYLTCPFRFYVSQILGLRTMDPDAREIPATDFGTVMHKVFEEFSCDPAMAGLTETDAIARVLGQRLDAVVPRYYGDRPSPIVKVQIESMRSRLKNAAATESKIRLEGWSTIATEYKVGKEQQLRLGKLAITGTMDRVDRHPALGLRILDYKTFTSRRTPAKTHLGAHRIRAHLGDAADLKTYTKKGELRLRSWIDLQLPLYHWIAGKIWPEDVAKGIQVGYFLLNADADPEKNALEILDLDDDMRASAIAAATRVVDQVHRGCFWPPAPANQVDYDDFADWFGSSRPEKIIDAESIEWLKGNHARA